MLNNLFLLEVNGNPLIVVSLK